MIIHLKSFRLGIVDFFEDAFVFKPSYLCLLLVFMYLLTTWVTNTFIVTNSYYYSAFGNQLTYDRIEEMIITAKKLQWVGYLVTCCIFFIKLYVVSGAIFTGILFSNMQIRFKDCFQIALLSELAFVVASVIKVAYFIFLPPLSLQDLQAFYPLSILSMVNISKLPTYLIYPLQQLNLFEIFYWVLLSVGIKVYVKIKATKAFTIVAMSYGILLLIWLMFNLFIQIQLS